MESILAFLVLGALFYFIFRRGGISCCGRSHSSSEHKENLEHKSEEEKG